MTTASFTRRIAILGIAFALSQCTAISALNTSAQSLDTYDLSPATGSTKGPRSAQTLLVARPDASAAIATDRIMIKPDPVSITYLPNARWSDEAPLVMQSLLIRSIAATGRVGYVGQSVGGPVPDTALLVRMDAFHVIVSADGSLNVLVDIALTVVHDRDQRVVGSRSFRQASAALDDSPAAIIKAFQAVLDALLPEMAGWVLRSI